jgi:hypothetical protein
MSDLSAGALTGPRLLTQPIEEYIGTYNDGVGLSAYKQWQVVPSYTNAVFNEQYFDIDAYQMDKLTLVPSGASLNDPGIYTIVNPFADSQQYVIDMITQTRLDPNQVVEDFQTLYNLPGDPVSTEDFSQILFGRFRWQAPTTDFSTGATGINAMTNISQGTFGSAEPTTANKLYCYRFVIMVATNLVGITIAVPATRFLLGATIVKEDELSFMMRQKRSFELQS